MNLSFLLLALCTGLSNGKIGKPVEPEDSSEQHKLKLSEICQSRGDRCAVHIDPFKDASSPIVFFLHSSGGLAEAFPFFTEGPDNGIIGVYPQGEGGWNTGAPVDKELLAQWEASKLDDVQFIKDIITELRRMDLTGNIYVVGSGTGAEFAYLLASNANKKELPIKGIIAKSMSLLEKPNQHAGYFTKPMGTTSPVSVLQIMGAEDSLVPFHGHTTKLYQENYYIMPALDSIKTWAVHNGCEEFAKRVLLNSNAGAETASFRNFVCEGTGTIVQLLDFLGVGHAVGDISVEVKRDDVSKKSKIDYDFIYNFIRKVENLESESISGTKSNEEDNCVNDPDFVVKGGYNCKALMTQPTKCNWTGEKNRVAIDMCGLSCKSECVGKKREAMLEFMNKKNLMD